MSWSDIKLVDGKPTEIKKDYGKLNSIMDRVEHGADSITIEEAKMLVDRITELQIVNHQYERMLNQPIHSVLRQVMYG